MSELNRLFRERIGLDREINISFDVLDLVLEKTAKAIPFENLCIMTKQTYEITKENIINKILVRKEGGLCYELNALLFYFLIENGFDAFLSRGIVYINDTETSPERTHLIILLSYNEQTYLVDTGFGGNLPLKPVPLTGETVTSSNGQFRLKKVESEHGDYLLEQKLKHKHTEWVKGYAFDSKKPITSYDELGDIQEIIAVHPKSPFNQSPLITMLTDHGNVTLTDTTFTQWENGVVTKREIEQQEFHRLKKEYFGLN